MQAAVPTVHACKCAAGFVFSTPSSTSLLVTWCVWSQRPSAPCSRLTDAKGMPCKVVAQLHAPENPCRKVPAACDCHPMPSFLEGMMRQQSATLPHAEPRQARSEIDSNNPDTSLTKQGADFARPVSGKQRMQHRETSNLAVCGTKPSLVHAASTVLQARARAHKGLTQHPHMIHMPMLHLTRLSLRMAHG